MSIILFAIFQCISDKSAQLIANNIGEMKKKVDTENVTETKARLAKLTALRFEYQQRLDNGETITQLARENGVSQSTMRWRLRCLGIDFSKKAEIDTRYGKGSRPKYQVSVFHGTSEVEAKLHLIAKEHTIDLANIRGVDHKLEAVLRALVVRFSMLQISKMMGVNEAAVRKWVKKYGIVTLGRGEWAKVYVGQKTVEELLDSKLTRAQPD
jgi:transposase-like protein